ncbi:adenosylcobinamide-GDP ribazoletransferase [Antarctobacter sp.]|uniref:adenosylcobinamide-GDP ribazoletransferase n=1 Tax=Antarctobacter sp. TaxID=1872577 RepID=UPI002B26CCC0|nr:adenosylcobinamide-GDP ribazoletransferase [Antarctobacter sp.]
MTQRRRLDELRLAAMMLTRVPMGRLADPAPTLTQARWAFPLVGLPLGLVAWALFAGATALGLPTLTTALAALAALAMLTGGLHHDGFADFADGMGGRDRAHRLEIMRDSRVGSYGVIALIFAVGLSASALGTVSTSAWAGFALVSVASRFAMLVLLDTLPPARDDGLGRMAAEARGALPWGVWLPGLVMIAFTVLLCGPAAIAVLAAMALVASLVARLAHRTLGGQTGDVLGAVQLATETVGWMTLAATL